MKNSNKIKVAKKENYVKTKQLKQKKRIFCIIILEAIATDNNFVRTRIEDRNDVNLNVFKRRKPHEHKSPHDYPSPISSYMIQLAPYTQNFITSSPVLERKTELDSIESNTLNRIANGFRTCKHFLQS